MLTNSLRRATSPLVEQFQTLVLTKEGATVFFDSYRVGPYAMGRLEAHIARSVIEPLLSPGVRERYGEIS